MKTAYGSRERRKVRESGREGGGVVMMYKLFKAHQEVFPGEIICSYTNRTRGKRATILVAANLPGPGRLRQCSVLADGEQVT